MSDPVDVGCAAMVIIAGGLVVGLCSGIIAVLFASAWNLIAG